MRKTVRVIDAFVDALDLGDLGVVSSGRGRVYFPKAPVMKAGAKSIPNWIFGKASATFFGRGFFRTALLNDQFSARRLTSSFAPVSSSSEASSMPAIVLLALRVARISSSSSVVSRVCVNHFPVVLGFSAGPLLLPGLL